jgi:hypothetical protein
VSCPFGAHGGELGQLVHSGAPVRADVAHSVAGEDHAVCDEPPLTAPPEGLCAVCFAWQEYSSTRRRSPYVVRARRIAYLHPAQRMIPAKQ